MAEFTKMVSEKWRNLTPPEKIPYENLSQKDKERYEAEVIISLFY